MPAEPRRCIHPHAPPLSAESKGTRDRAERAGVQTDTGSASGPTRRRTRSQTARQRQPRQQELETGQAVLADLHFTPYLSTVQNPR
ncbi:hypothetical protein AAFF_G00219360 [Aldrovandia affinis]|uniref:Uncharacterized protein n=1 Tax=Aldrovandia affinis TaxID=143900 RepID=A0AAD7RIT7_9TELE|nr:hypothetical protein AAFF_G00219360 [Aldrovandia affinis]